MSLNGINSTGSTDTTVGNTCAFFPEIALQPFIDIYRLPGEYNEPTLIQALKTAIYDVNDELIDFVLVLQSVNEAETLEAFDADLVDVYKTAVMSTARSGLIKFFETINRKTAAEIQGDRGEELRDMWKDEANRCMDRISKALLDSAEKDGALMPRRTFASGFRARVI